MKVNIYYSVLMIIPFFAINNISFAQWTQLSDMPTARNAHAIETVNGKIYVFGGEQSKSKTVEEYNPATDTWVTKADMPTERGWLSCSVVNKKIYAIGGYNPATVDNIEEYDPETDTWTTKSPMPTARWGPSTGTVNGKIYVFGGASGWDYKVNGPNAFCGTNEVYNPTTDIWTSKNPTPILRWGSSCCVVNGKIYVVGGYDNEGTSSTVEEYDPVTDTWTTKTPMPTSRWGLTTGVINEKIYAIGGGDIYPPTKRYKVVEEYDPVTDTWTTKTPIPVGRIAHAPHSVSIDGKIYVVGGGGLKASDAYAEVFVYDPANEKSTIDGNFEFEGYTRNYMVSLPSKYSNIRKFPLIIYLHSYGWIAQQGMKYTLLNTVADTSDFVVAYPSAVPNWNSGIGDNPNLSTPEVNDVGFINALIDTLSNKYSIDLDRVYACGYSNGGFMAYKLACQLGHRFAAIASVGGVLSTSTADNCNPLRTMPVLQIHGTSDPWVPIAGDDGWYSADETLSYWININNCVEADTTILPDLDQTDGCWVEKICYTNCSDESSVIFYKVINGGHTWPGAGPPGYKAGNTNQDIHASTLILNFFKNLENPIVGIEKVK